MLFQNKKGQKNFPGAPFSVSFSQLPAVKKTPKTVQWNFFWPFLFCDGFRYLKQKIVNWYSKTMIKID